MRIGILVEKRYLAQAQPGGLISALGSAGHETVCIDPQAAAYALEDARWTDKLDLIVARGRSQPLLCMLGWAQARGISAVNSRSAIASVHNKADMAVIMAEAGVPSPRTFLGPVAELAGIIPSSLYPVVLKPVFGDNSRGLRLVRTGGEMRSIEWPEPVALAQRFIPNDGYDLKLYCIGDEVWPVRKPSPAGLAGAPGAHGKAKAGPAPLTKELEALGRRLGRLFGLELYGVDCIESAEGPSVIEVNEFPNYTGVPDADRRLAEYVTRARAAGGRI
ncbi:MAG: ATP-grasp domain-containing protein [Elusimicrobiales bacterium]|jgi:ribosomal protein S6--L-glutamate ligase